jgi:lipid A 3-O-deacylase
MKTRPLAPLLSLSFLLFAVAVPAFPQAAVSDSTLPARSSAADADAPARATLAQRPWEFGPYFQGGEGVGARYGFTFASAGVRLGKVITGPHLGSWLRGQFELAGELVPYWQAFTPPPHLMSTTVYDPAAGLSYTDTYPVGGGTYTGVSLEPVILRWHFQPGRRFATYFQGAGGLIYTTHKFPPDTLVPHGLPGGTSVFNFSPQGGFGVQYFLRPGRSIYVQGSGVHISSASLGDRNPGVNASVQFQIGYTFWR